jgi:hypothetical protein
MTELHPDGAIAPLEEAVPTKTEGKSSSSSCQARGALGRPCPRHELVETRGRPEIDQFGEHVGDILLRVNTVKFAGLDERSDAGPVLRALIVAREECVFAIENNRTDAAFDNVGIEFDAAVVEEPREPVPVIQGIPDVLGDRRLARDARELLLEPGFEGQHEGLAALLAHRTALVGAAAADRLLDRIEGSGVNPTGETQN